METSKAKVFVIQLESFLCLNLPLKVHQSPPITCYGPLVWQLKLQKLTKDHHNPSAFPLW